MSESVTSTRTNDTADRSGANEVSMQSRSLPAVPFFEYEEKQEKETAPLQLKAAATSAADAASTHPGITAFKNNDTKNNVRDPLGDGISAFKPVVQKKESTGSHVAQFKTTENRNVQQPVIQRAGGDPDYQLQAGAAAGLSEEKYVNNVEPATGVQFTAFTSCIGIVGLTGDKIVAAHLVMLGTNDTPVDPASVGTVFAGATDMMVFGHIENWSAESNGRPMAKLSTQLAEVAEWNSKDNGTYKVTRVGDDWVIT